MEENKYQSENVISNMVWKVAEKLLCQFIVFVLTLILARKLAPVIYGVVALVKVLVRILQEFIADGLSSALIQKKDADELDFSTVFYANIVFSLVLYALIFFIAPLIEDFYNIEQLAAIIRVAGVVIIISSFRDIHRAYVAKNMMFKKFFFSSLIGTLASAVVGIYLAYNDYGAWSLVGQLVTDTLIDTICLCLTIRWRPIKGFSFERLKPMFKFSIKYTGSRMLKTVYAEVCSLVIGKRYSTADLAFYERGRQLPNVSSLAVNEGFNSVIYPVMSAAQDDKKKLKEVVRTTVKVSAYLIWPLMLGLLAVSENAVKLFLGVQWVQCVEYIMIFCFVYGIVPFTSANSNALKALGMSEKVLRNEFLSKVVDFICLAISINKGPFVICIFELVACPFRILISAYDNKKLLDYSMTQEIIDAAPALGLSILMAIPVYFIGKLSLPLIMLLPLQVIAGIVIYVLISKLFKISSYYYMLDNAKKILKKFKRS